jgi:hypothetical protein
MPQAKVELGRWPNVYCQRRVRANARRLICPRLIDFLRGRQCDAIDGVQ